MTQKLNCEMPFEKYTDSNIKRVTFTMEYSRGDDGKINKAFATNIGMDCDGEYTLLSGFKIDLICHDDLDLLRTFFKGLDFEKIIKANT